jgi:hypothetical protein
LCRNDVSGKPASRRTCLPSGILKRTQTFSTGGKYPLSLSGALVQFNKWSTRRFPLCVKLAISALGAVT